MRTWPSGEDKRTPAAGAGYQDKPEPAGRPPIDPYRPALDYLTFDRPGFHVETDWDFDGNGWEIDEPGLHVTCRICGIPVAALVYAHAAHADLPKMVWGLTGIPPHRFASDAIGDIAEPGLGLWTWDDAVAEIQDRLGNTSLAGAITGRWHDMAPPEDGSEPARQRDETPHAGIDPYRCVR